MRHWVTVMVDGTKERGGRGQEGRHQNYLLYTDDGMFALLDPQWLQGGFSTLVGLFDMMGLKTNVGKTVGMFCRPFQAAGTQSKAACRRKMTGEGPLYWERQQGRV